MSEVIAFLEVMGRTSALVADAGQMEAVSRFEPDVRAALLARDSAALARLLGGSISMVCSVVAPDFDEPTPDEQPAVPDDLPGEDDARAA